MQYLFPLVMMLFITSPEIFHRPWQQGPTPADGPVIALHSPLPGQALQGIVPIMGNTAIEGFLSAELSFAYFDDRTGTWFLIAEYSVPVADGILAQWDTTTISDGNYTLRLEVALQNGEQQTVTVAGVRVRNYTPIETNTPTSPAPTATSVPGNTPTPTLTPTVTLTLPPLTITPLPSNPVQISNQDVLASLGQGALATLGLFAVLGCYGLIRTLINHKR